MRMQGWQMAVAIGLGMSGAIGLPSITLAQTAPSNIVPDATLGAERSQVIQNFGGLPIEAISGGAQRGQNLFHSFSEFNVSAGRGAYFAIQNDAVRNVLTRVTGGSRSDILGTLGTFRPSDGSVRVPEVNLFLVNPGGIVFGENASLDVGGSFFATTANAVQLGDADLFSASQPASSNLLNVSPSAFLFNAIANQNLPEIVVRSRATTTVIGNATFGLLVPDGQNLLLLGGNVGIEGGYLNAWGGRIDIGAIGGRGTIGLNANGGLNVPEGVNRADVRFTGNALLDVTLADKGDISVTARNINILGQSRLLTGIYSGFSSGIQAGDLNLDATGEVQVSQSGYVGNVVENNSNGDGGNLTIKAASLTITDGSQVISGTYGRGNAGSVVIEVRGRAVLDNGSISSITGQASLGNGGNVVISTGSLELKNGAQFNVRTSSRGNAGDIVIKAADRLALSGRSPDGISSSIHSSVGFEGAGKSGSINISTNTLELRDGAQLVADTFGKGNVGNLNIRVFDTARLDDSYIISSVSPTSVGNGGNINVETRSLGLSNGAQLISNAGGLGEGGNITIHAAGSIAVDGVSPDGKVSSGIISNVSTESRGRGGNITILAEDILKLSNGGQLRATTQGSGDGGQIQINALNAISIAGRDISSTVPSRISTSATSEGRGGNISIATSALQIVDRAEFNAVTNGKGNGGNILIDVRNVLDILNGGVLNTTTTSNGQTGRIVINADRILITGSDYSGKPSSLSIQFTPFSNAGELELNARTLKLDNRGQIVASAPSGNGGNLTLNIRDLLLLRHGSQISVTAGSESQTGNGGNITVNSGFIIAIPKENSDITANAFSGSGGNITISSQGIFGLKVQPKLTPLSDITASSDVGFSGIVNLNTPDYSLIQNSLTEFPQTFTDTTQLLANSCIVRSAKQNGRFVITGSGGLPQRPGDALMSPFPTGEVRTVAADSATDETDKLSPQSQSVSSIPHPLPRPWKIGDPIVEPQGVYQLANGELVMSRECSK